MCSIQNYWFRKFLLPKSVLNKISQLCSHFFWKGNNTFSRGARVSCQAICHPKVEGGLGLKDTLSWNQMCMIHHLWSIFSKSGSLWLPGSMLTWDYISIKIEKIIKIDKIWLQQFGFLIYSIKSVWICLFRFSRSIFEIKYEKPNRWKNRFINLIFY